MIKLKCGKIFDSVHGKFKGPGTIHIENGRIVKVNDDLAGHGDADADSDGDIIDLSGHTILPGFIDSHDHLGFSVDESKDDLANEPSAWVMAKMVRNAQTVLNAGITTLRNMGEKNHIDLSARRALAEGYFPGPRILVSGLAMTMTGGTQSWFDGTEVDSVEEVRKHVRAEVKAGVDFLKMFLNGSAATASVSLDAPPCFSEEEITVAAQEAHRAGKFVAVHAHTPQAVRWALAAGVDTIEHGVLLDEETLTQMAERRVPLVYTAGYYKVCAESTTMPEFMRTRSKMVLEQYFKTMEMARKVGVTVALGTDEVHARIDVEVQSMMRGGYNLEEALSAATLGGAKACMLESSLGSLDAGKIADIIALDGDPRQDIGALSRVKFVMRSGKVMVQQ